MTPCQTERTVFLTYLHSLNKGIIFLESFSADRKPCENNMTSAIKAISGLVIANDLKSFFKFSGKLERPAYVGFIVINIAMSVLTLTCFPISSTVSFLLDLSKA